jgi:hypothetical protein
MLVFMIQFHPDTGVPEFTEGAKRRFARFEKEDIDLNSPAYQEAAMVGAFAGSTIFVHTTIDMVRSFGRLHGSSLEGLSAESSAIELTRFRRREAITNLNMMLLQWKESAFGAAMNAAETAISAEIEANVEQATL